MLSSCARSGIRQRWMRPWRRFLDRAEEIARRLERAARIDEVADLDRVRNEVVMFVKQGRRAMRVA
jgi:hypothetical protein